MRKWLIALAVVLVGGALLAPSAQAFRWHLRFNTASQGTKEIEKEYCEIHHPEDCTGYGAKCHRITNSRVDCIGATWLATEYGEMECWSVYHWGVRRGGHVKVRMAHPHCEYVTE